MTHCTTSFARRVAAAACAAALITAFPATAEPTRNGVGGPHDGRSTDYDGDGNPSTNVHGFDQELDPAFDPPWLVLGFEKKNGHGDAIKKATVNGHKLSFSDGLSRQICDGPRYFRYDSKCPYLKPPSGEFAAYYRNDLAKPLNVDFEKPVCAVSMAIYPSGGREGEEFEAIIEAYRDGELVTERRVAKAVDLTWSVDVIQPETSAGRFEEVGGFDRVAVRVRSTGAPRDEKPLRSAPRGDADGVDLVTINQCLRADGRETWTEEQVEAIVEAGIDPMIACEADDIATGRDREVGRSLFADAEASAAGDGPARPLRFARYIDDAERVARRAIDRQKRAREAVPFIVDDLAFIEVSDASPVSACREQIDLRKAAP